MYRIAERIENGGAIVGDLGIELPNVIFGDRKIFGEGAVAIDADDLDSLANVRLAGPAEQTRQVHD